MRATVKLPKLGDTATSGVIVEWHVSPGDSVAEAQPLVSIETDKAVNELPSPVSGQVSELLAAIDDEVPVGEPICVIETQD